MDIDKVIQNLREAKKKASCPPGFKYSKKICLLYTSDAADE